MKEQKLLSKMKVSAIRAADLRPGDIIILTHPGSLTKEQCSRVAKLVEENIPGHLVLLFEQGIKVQALLHQQEAGNGQADGNEHAEDPLPVGQPESADCQGDAGSERPAEVTPDNGASGR